MKINQVLITAFILFLTGCGQVDKDPKATKANIIKMDNSEIIKHVKLAISPKFQDWVLFKNGTYIIFDNADTIKNVNDEAIKQMKEFGPVFAGGPAGDFSTIHLTQTDGWVISGHGYGMYTYVNPSEIENKTPNDIEIGLFGRTKRDIDGKKPEIIYTSSRKN